MPVERIRDVCSELADVLNEIDVYYTDSMTPFEAPTEVGDGDTLVQYIRRAVRGFYDDDQTRRRRQALGFVEEH